MSNADDERKKRAEERRKTMKIRFTTLDDQTDPWPVFGTAGVQLAAAITRQIWSFSGREVPTYERSEIPMRFVSFDPE